MTIFTITSSTSGCGKTFLARLLGTRKSREGKRVLYLSFNLIQKEKGTHDMIEVLKEEITLTQALIRDPMQGMDLVIGSNGSSMPVPFATARLDLLKDDILTLADEYDMVLMDMPSEYLFFAKGFSDAFYLILTPDVRTMASTHRMLRQIPEGKTGVIINRVKDKTEGQRIYDILASTQEYAGSLLPLKAIIREGRTAAFEDLEEAAL